MHINYMHHFPTPPQNVIATIYHQPRGTGPIGPVFLDLFFAGFCGTVGT